MASLLRSIIFSIVATLAWSLAGTQAASVPAIFVFGDSLADVGNNNYLIAASVAKANFPPNGIDFPHSTPTGRFSNGYNTVDWLAKFVGFPQSPPPFLSLKNGSQMFQGVNFASGGSGILDSTGTEITFNNQIVDFKSVINVFVKLMGEERAAYFLSKSLFLISTGSNDMFNYYSTFAFGGAQNTTQNELFVGDLVTKFTDQLKELYNLGARKFGIMGIPHLGCIPLMRNLIPNGQCAEVLNGMARAFNTDAKSQMVHLKSTLQGMKYSYGNVYDVNSQYFAKPYLFGYTEVKGACCGSGKFNGGLPCIPNATYCSDRNQYLFWDRFHPTQFASKNLAGSLYAGSQRSAAPINIKSLAKL